MNPITRGEAAAFLMAAFSWGWIVGSLIYNGGI